MSEHEPRPVQDSEEVDWRRLHVASARFSEYITEGIARAMANKTEIDDGTARCIAHVLGRAHGRQSALAAFGRTGEGDYPSLRDEYLTLYNAPTIAAHTKELIDWLGTYLVQRDGRGNRHGERGENYNTAPTPVGTGEVALEAAKGLDFPGVSSVNPEELTEGGPYEPTQ